MDKATLYIGANNDTGGVEVDKIINIISEYHDGFTIVPTVGVWEGKREDSVMVIIYDERLEAQDIKDMVEWLIMDLGQEAVFLEVESNVEAGVFDKGMAEAG